MDEKIVLVSPNDEIIGTMEKLQAHQNGLLHRAFSIFLFNDKGEMLLQKRADTKYHSPKLWTNAVCSHPRLGETYADAAKRRLREELGISAEIEEKFHFIYKADVGEGLWEHELDYVFTGTYNDDFQLNTNEVSEVRYISWDDLERELHDKPQNFTEWFKIILKEYKQNL